MAVPEAARRRAEAAAGSTSLPDKPRMAEVEGLYHSLVAARVLADARAAKYALLDCLCAEGRG